MSNITTLNIIRHKINEFEPKCRLMIAANNIKHFSGFREFNEEAYYCLYFNKRDYFVSYNLTNTHTSTGQHCVFTIPNQRYNLDKTSIEDFLLTQVDDLYLPPPVLDKNFTTIYDNINYIISTKSLSKIYKLKLFNGEEQYTIDNDSLYIFIRLLPTLSTSLNPMLFSIKCANVYSLCNGDHNHINSIGFVVKLDNRFSYKRRDVFYYHKDEYERKVDKIVGIKYPFINKEYINKHIFEDYEMAKTFQYKVQVTMLYMPTLKLANKYGIKVLTSF